MKFRTKAKVTANNIPLIGLRYAIKDDRDTIIIVLKSSIFLVKS